MPQTFLNDGVTELKQSGRRVGLVFRDSAGSEHWALASTYSNPGGTSTADVIFENPSDPAITATTAVEFKDMLLAQDIWESSWTYLKKTTMDVEYGPNGSDQVPMPQTPAPVPNQPATPPTGIDLGSVGVTDTEGGGDLGMSFSDRGAGSTSWHEVWLLNPGYTAPPSHSVDLGAPTTNFTTQSAFLADVRNKWKAGSQLVTISCCQYSGDIPTPP